jgi:hypothetical protein
MSSSLKCPACHLRALVSRRRADTSAGTSVRRLCLRLQEKELLPRLDLAARSIGLSAQETPPNQRGSVRVQ